MSARESIESLWDRATPVAPLLDAYRDGILREAAEKIRDVGSDMPAVMGRHLIDADLMANAIDPDKPAPPST